MPWITCKDLQKEYRSGTQSQMALNHVDFSLEQGEYVAIVGKSGSGKSTLMNMLGLIDTPTGGSMIWNGEQVLRYPERKKTQLRNQMIGYVFQAFYLEPSYTVYQNIEIPLLIAGRAPARQDDADAAIWLSEDAAAQLGAVCGDTVSFCADSTAAQSISCQIAGIYQQNIYLYTYYVSLPLYLQSLDTVESMQVTLAPLNLKDYQNVLAELRANRIFPDEAQEFMDSVMLLVYALYVVCVFLCILEVGMVFTISRSYFHRRTAFFAVCKALGMQNQSMLLTVCMLMQALLSVAFLAAMLLAPYLNRYVGNLLNELFTDVKISESVWNLFSLLILLITSGLLWLTCICSQKTYAAPELVELIRQEDQ